MIRSQSIWALNGVGFGCTLQLRFSLMFLILTLFCMENRWGASDESVMKVVFLPAWLQLYVDGSTCFQHESTSVALGHLPLGTSFRGRATSWVRSVSICTYKCTYHGMTHFLSSHCKVDFWVADEKSKQLSADQLAKLSQVMGWLGMYRWKAVWGDLHVYNMHTHHIGKNMLIMSQCHTWFHISHIWHMMIMYINLLCACIQAAMAGNSQRVNPLSSYVAVISFPFAGAGPGGDGALVSWDA